MRTSAVLLLVSGVWPVLLPPFFTHGACTAEFDAANDARNGASQRHYQDSSIRLQLGYNSMLQLARVQTDMKPYRTLKLPLLGVEL